MRKTFAALALATLITLAAPVVAQADDRYPPDPPALSPASTTVVDRPAGPARAALPATGMSDAVVPIGIAGGILALGGVGLLVTRRLARR